MLASTAVAELAAVSLRPTLVDQAVVHHMAVHDVMVASAAKAAPAELFRHREGLRPSPRHRALARLVVRSASRAGNVSARSFPLQKKFVGRLAVPGRHPPGGRCPLSSHGGSLLFLLPWSGVWGEAWHIRTISLVITAYPRRCFIPPP